MKSKEVTVEVISGKVGYRKPDGGLVRVTPESNPNTLKVREHQVARLKPLVRVVEGNGAKARVKPKKTGGSDGVKPESQDSGTVQPGEVPAEL